jgi:hypothetical protein
MHRAIPSPSSLERDLKFLLACILLFGLLASGWITYATYREQTRISIHEIENDALRVDRHMLLTVENASYLLESLGRQILTLGPEKLTDITQLLTSFHRTSGADTDVLSWISNQQELLVSNQSGIVATPIDVSDRDYVKKAVAEPWKLHVGQPIKGRLSHKWVLPLSIGLTNSEGDLAGIVLLGMDIGALKQQLAGLLHTKGLNVAITNRALTLITQTNASSQNFQEQFSLVNLAKHDFKAKQKLLISHPEPWNKHRSLQYAEASDATPFIMFYSLSAEDYLQAITANLTPRLLQLILVIAFLVTILWSVRRRMIRPIIELTHRTALSVRGEDFHAEAQRGPREIQALAIEIRRMVDFLEERKRLENELRNKLEIQTSARKTLQTHHRSFGEVTSLALKEIEHILHAVNSTPELDSDAIALLPALLREMRSTLPVEGEPTILHEMECDSSQMLRRSIVAFHEKYGRSGIAVIDGAAVLPRIQCDEARLQHMLQQLLESEYLGLAEGHSIRITSAIRTGDWWLTIAYHTQQIAALTHLRQMLTIALTRIIMAWHQGTVEIKTTPDGNRSITLRFPAERLI